MKRTTSLLLVAALAVTTAELVHADVKTQHKVMFQLGGSLGGLVNRFAGDAAKDGVVETVALKGSRMLTAGPQSGQIIDLAEEKVYDLDIRKKEYRVTTFAELRKKWQDAQEKMKKDMKNQPGAADQPADPSQSGKQFDVSFDVQDTGQKKTIAGQNTHEVVLTVTMHEKGKTVEEGGGLVMSNHLWLAPKVEALDEIAEFHMKFAKAVYGDLLMGADAQSMGMLLASYPSFKELSEKMATEAKKLQGTPMLTTTVLEAVRSAADMAAAPAAPAPSGGGGLMGRLAGKLGPKPKPTEARSKAFNSSTEVLSLETTVSAEDTAIPAGFKEKK
jgi:hypothetical protein